MLWWKRRQCKRKANCANLQPDLVPRRLKDPLTLTHWSSLTRYPAIWGSCTAEAWPQAPKRLKHHPRSQIIPRSTTTFTMDLIVQQQVKHSETLHVFSNVIALSHCFSFHSFQGQDSHISPGFVGVAGPPSRWGWLTRGKYRTAQNCTHDGPLPGLASRDSEYIVHHGSSWHMVAWKENVPRELQLVTALSLCLATSSRKTGGARNFGSVLWRISESLAPSKTWASWAF